MKPTLSDCLKAFNRKERYWVVDNFVAKKDEDEPHKLSNYIRDELEELYKVEISKDSWWAMDYHFDWIVAAIYLYNDLKTNEENLKFKNTKKINHGEKVKEINLINGTHEDVDFIIVHDNEIFLIEAKCFSPWLSKQLDSKIDRIKILEKIIKDFGLDIKVYFALTSPKEPSFDYTKQQCSCIKQVDYFRLVPKGNDLSKLRKNKCEAKGFYRAKRLDKDKNNDKKYLSWKIYIEKLPNVN